MYTMGPPYPLFCIQIQPTAGGKYLEKNSRKFQKAKLEFATWPATIYIAFTLY